LYAVHADLLVDDGPALRLVVGHIAGTNAVLSAALARNSIHPGLNNPDISFQLRGMFLILHFFENLLGKMVESLVLNGIDIQKSRTCS